MLAAQHLSSTRGLGRSAFADVPKLPPVARPRHLAVNNSASIAAPLAPIREEQTQESRKGIDKIKAITSGELNALLVLMQQSFGTCLFSRFGSLANRVILGARKAFCWQPCRA